MTMKLAGLVAATHTPFHADGQINLDALEKQAEHLIRSGVTAVFICGTTGESHSLSVEERLALANRWSEAVKGSQLRLIVHVGSNCIADGRILAAQAEKMKASAIAALAPSYFKPGTLEALVGCCNELANAAPSLPFYYYDIPHLTGVRFSMPEFLSIARDRIPTLTGIKYTNNDQMMYQQCLQLYDRKFDMLWGIDECLLPALVLGATGAVGSSYNFAAPLYNRILAAFSRGDLETCRAEQFRSVQLIQLLSGYGYLASAKAAMSFLGVDVGPVRLPNSNLTSEQRVLLRADLENIGFFDWGANRN
jgi:N-acetylneuraminate lyase